MPALAEIIADPALAQRGLSLVAPLEEAIKVLAKAESRITRPDPYDQSTAGASYDQDEITALREQVTQLTTTCRHLVDLHRTLLAALRE